MRVPPHLKLLLGILSGAGFGLVARAAWGDHPRLVWTVENVAGPLGQIWLRLLFMIVVPMLFSAVVVGISGLELRRLGRIGVKTLAYTVVVSGIAVLIGMTLVNVVRPGDGLPPELRERAFELAQVRAVPKPLEVTAAQQIVSMVPDNPLRSAAQGDMLGLIVFAVIFGVAVSVTRIPPVERLREMLEGLYEVTMTIVGWVMRLAPVGVGLLVFSVTARLGLDILQQLGAYVAVVVGALALHMFIVYSASVRFLGGRSPIQFFRDCRLAITTAFATSSSSATLPTALRVAEENLKLPNHVSRFVLTAGAAMNQNGTALFEGVTVLFLAQFFDVELSLSQQFVVMLICILGGIGTAGIPAASLPVIAMICAMFGIPPEGLAIVLGVDRFLDMCRTTVNVTGDLAAAVVVSRGEPSDEAVEAEHLHAARSLE
ncbi:MAG: dicarboxylate/amino acid:cation symporter [Myxococcaceae bacterium]